MAFNKILPPAHVAKVRGTSMVRISVMKSKKSGTCKATLSLADTFLTSLVNFKNITHFVAFEGDGEDSGKMRLEFAKPTDEGAFKFSKAGKGGGRAGLPKFELLPNFAVGRTACKVESSDAAGFTIVLPVEEWQGVRAMLNKTTRPLASTVPAIASSGGRTVDPARASVVTPASSSQARDEQLVNLAGNVIIDASVTCKPIEYCKKKGVRLSKLNGNYWQWTDTTAGSTSERIDDAELVIRVNKFRSKSGLPKIAYHQFVREVEHA